MTTDTRVSTGVPGFDEVLSGGLIAGRTYLLSGPAGTGKTTLGWHFLTTGSAAGERVLFVTFAEPESELRANAARLGFDVRDCTFVDLSPGPDAFRSDGYDVFSASDVERMPMTRRIIQAVDELHPARVFVDSMTSLRYFSADPYDYRRRALGFLRYLAGAGATVLATSESTAEIPDDDLRFLADGVIELDLVDRSRGLRITKMRGSGFRAGRHSLALTGTGASVFPRLLPEQHQLNGRLYPRLSTGLPALDKLCGGGLEHGTVSLISGPTGVGKTTLGAQLLTAAAGRGERSAVYVFDELAQTVLARCDAVAIPLRALSDDGTIVVRQIEALRYGPDEFADLVRRDVADGVRTVMIDSISGYRMTMTGAENLSERLHALCRYLQNVDVSVLLIDELRELDSFRVTEVGISYLADNVFFLRYTEASDTSGLRMQRAIGVLKKRLGNFERIVRNFDVTARGIDIGGPLAQTSLFRGFPRAGSEAP